MRAEMPFSALQTSSIALKYLHLRSNGAYSLSNPRVLAQLPLVGASPWRRLGPVRGLARGSERPDRRQSRADRGVQVDLCQPDRLGPNRPSGGGSLPGRSPYQMPGTDSSGVDWS